MPYFQWSDAKSAVLLEGRYQIEVSRDTVFQDMAIKDEMPAIIAHYSPHVALETSVTYFWRVRYVTGEAKVGEWSKAERFVISLPAYVRDVPAKATWQEIQSCLADVVGHSEGGAKVMFPCGVRYDLTCGTDGTVPFDLKSASNIVID
jgi:hypothetical protein